MHRAPVTLEDAVPACWQEFMTHRRLTQIPPNRHTHTHTPITDDKYKREKTISPLSWHLFHRFSQEFARCVLPMTWAAPFGKIKIAKLFFTDSPRTSITVSAHRSARRCCRNCDRLCASLYLCCCFLVTFSPSSPGGKARNARLCVGGLSASFSFQAGAHTAASFPC